MNSTQNQTAMEYRVIVCDKKDQERFIEEQALFSWRKTDDYSTYGKIERYNELLKDHEDKIFINVATNKAECTFNIFERNTATPYYQELVELETEIFTKWKKLKGNYKLRWKVPDDPKELRQFKKEIKKEYSSNLGCLCWIGILLLIWFGALFSPIITFIILWLSIIGFIIDSMKKDTWINELIKIYRMCEEVYNMKKS